MSKGVGMTTQIKRPNPKFTLGFNRDAAKLVNAKGHTHRQAADSLGMPLRNRPMVECRTRPRNRIHRQDGSLELGGPSRIAAAA